MGHFNMSIVNIALIINKICSHVAAPDLARYFLVENWL